MPQKLCPVCNQVITYMENTIDVMHTCNTGNPTLDEQDILYLEDSNWNLKGAANKADPKARILGYNIDTPTNRGNRVTTHRQMDREVDINTQR